MSSTTADSARPLAQIGSALGAAAVIIEADLGDSTSADAVRYAVTRAPNVNVDELRLSRS